MQRIAAVWHASPQKMVGVLFALLLAAGMAVGSGANFNAQTTNVGTFASGSLLHTNDKDGAVVVSLSNMKPGATANGTAVITNTGTLPGAFTIARTALTGDAGLGSAMDLKIEDVTVPASPVTVYNGKLDAAALATPIALSPASWATNAAHSYKFTATFPLASGNSLQNQAASATFTFENTPA